MVSARSAVLAVLLGSLVSPSAAAPAVEAAALHRAAPATTTGTLALVRPGFIAPLSGTVQVLTPFDPPAERYGRGHRGVDLAASPGAPVGAAGPGTVVYAGLLAGRGVVSIQHASGLRTTYEPVTASVSPGTSVPAGRQIGTLSAGHASCAPRSCLHWGARLGPQTYVDPMLLIGRVRIRLEPWSR